jgi:hypothetical protein
MLHLSTESCVEGVHLHFVDEAISKITSIDVWKQMYAPEYWYGCDLWAWSSSRALGYDSPSSLFSCIIAWASPRLSLRIALAGVRAVPGRPQFIRAIGFVIPSSWRYCSVSKHISVWMTLTTITYTRAACPLFVLCVSLDLTTAPCCAICLECT